MLRFCNKSLVRMMTVKPCGSAKSYNLVRSVPLIFATDRNLTQKNVLPKMPVPPLKQTFECYLSMLESIVTADELKHTTKLVEEFLKPEGIGERLQKGLEKKACTTENWSTNDYLKNFRLCNRKPVVIHSNYGILFSKKDIKDKQGQIRCAAEFIASMLDIKTMIDNDRLEVEFMEGKPLCMKQYEQVISSCRIPNMKTDSLMFHANISQPSKHITVVHKCQFYELDVYNSDGTLLTVEELCTQLDRICKPSVMTDIDPVGILTTQQRDIWCKTYNYLLQDKTNNESLSAIQRSIFTVCLDDAKPPMSDEIMYHKHGVLQMLHGGGSNWNSGNRWFDKGLQIIIGQDGTWGINSSHATADGIVLMDMCDRAVAKMKNERIMPSSTKNLTMPKKLHFNITPDIRKDIEEAKRNIDLMVQKLNLRVMVFPHFGKNLIKAYKMSPDAFVQMALQLAYYRIFKQCCAVMEPVSLRMFTLGRVAPIHANSGASTAFIKAFDDPPKKNLEKVDLLDKAIREHRRLIKMAINGHAIGVHLTGLMLQAVEENIPSLDIFTDVSFVKAMDFKLSTSQVTSKMGCLPCIGPEEPGTYDVAYSIMDNHIDCTVSCFEASKTHTKLNPRHLIQAIEGALLDMRTLLEQTQRLKY